MIIKLSILFFQYSYYSCFIFSHFFIIAIVAVVSDVVVAVVGGGGEGDGVDVVGGGVMLLKYNKCKFICSVSNVFQDHLFILSDTFISSSFAIYGHRIQLYLLSVCVCVHRHFLTIMNSSQIFVLLNLAVCKCDVCVCV